MDETLLYPVELVRVLMSIRTVSDAVIMGLTMLAFWHTAFVVKSEADLSDKAVHVVANWAMIVIMYTFARALMEMNIIRTNTLRFLYDTMNFGMLWVIFAAKAGDILDWIDDMLPGAKCDDRDIPALVIGGLVVIATMIPAGFKMVYVLAGLLTLSAIMYLIERW